MERTVFIDTNLGYNVLDFKLNQDQKLALMHQGNLAEHVLEHPLKNT